ncbi:MAG: response regulator [Sulfuricella sp.]|nr:response regulator [Sulfuricella sp.]
MNPSNKVVDILLVEDNPGDVRLTEEALRESGLKVNLRVVRDGLEALSALRGEELSVPPAHPDLILLDLNMPRMDGRELLGIIKTDDRLKRIPVVVLTTSAADQDVERAYELHANCYITKPVELDRFIDIVHSIKGFWLSVARLPDSSHP